MSPEEASYRFAGFLLDVQERRLTGPGPASYLPPRTFDTLLCLLLHAGSLVTKEQLLSAVWKDAAVTDNAMTRCIREIRIALGDDAHEPRFIETVPRIGYRFIAPVERLASREGLVSGPATAPDVGGVRDDVSGRPAPAPVRFWSQAWRRRGLKLAPFGLLLLFVLGSTSYLSFQPNRVPTFGPRDFILITDALNETGEAIFDRSLSTAFTVSMEQSRFANVFSRSRAASTLARMGKAPATRIDEVVGREICRRESIRGLVSLGIQKVARQYALTARLIDPHSGEPVRSAVAYAPDQAHVLDALQSLATDVRRSLGESLAAIRSSNRPLLQVTTPSIKALEAYSNGMALWEKGEYRPALRLYETAVADDPEFAKAYAALGSAYYSHVFSDPVKGRQYYERALALADRTTDRERMSIQIDYQHDLGHVQAASDQYRVYLQAYPDDFHLRYNYGIFLRENNRPREAIIQYQETIRLAPGFAGGFVNLATAFRDLSQPVEALANYGRAFALEPRWLTTGNLNHEYGFALVMAGEADRARLVFEEGLAAGIKPQALRSLALLELYLGRPGRARIRLDQAIALNVSEANGLSEARNRLFLSMVLDARANRAGALRELGGAAQALARSGNASWMCSRVGVAFVRAGAIGRAEEMLARVRAGSDTANPQQKSDLHRLEGELAWALGDRDTAMARLRLAEDEYQSAFTVGSLARASRLAGDVTAAIALYERLVGMPGLCLGFEPQQDWSEAHLWLARLLVSAGDREKAAAVLAAFQPILSGAEPDAPLARGVSRLAADLQALQRR
ncbi:MAG TPA: winged helix-turn-helix domain-containing protein [Vicinamibacterales bacterium]|jgi:DNA-binding winged helix-turn-helix (wHTH) protein/tetratricopeptide (TPR) repeat protein